MLPAQEEAHKVLLRDRVDLFPEPVKGVAMDARQQPPVTVLVLGAIRTEPPSEHEAIRLEHLQSALDVDGGGEQARAQLRRRHRSRGFAPPPEHARAGVVAVFDAHQSSFGREYRRLDCGVRVEEADEVEVLSGEEEAGAY